jgi:DUF2911 family protein
MTRLSGCMVLVASLLWAPSLHAQGTSALATATCNFNANNQLAVEYQRLTVNSKKAVFGHEIPYNKPWAPGGRPMTLFTNLPIAVDGHDIPVGGYTLFLIPSEKQWMLVISKSTDTSGRYDEADDLVRVPMDVGELSNPEDEFSVYFGHIAPNQCSMRVDLEKERAWVTFEKK